MLPESTGNPHTSEPLKARPDCPIPGWKSSFEGPLNGRSLLSSLVYLCKCGCKSIQKTAYYQIFNHFFSHKHTFSKPSSLFRHPRPASVLPPSRPCPFSSPYSLHPRLKFPVILPQPFLCALPVHRQAPLPYNIIRSKPPGD